MSIITRPFDRHRARILMRDWGQMNARAAARRGTTVPITRLMHMLWLMRPDLQKTYPLDHDRGRLGYATWFVNIGRFEYGLGDWLVPAYDLETLKNEIDPDMLRGQPGGESFYHAIWRQRPDLQAAYPLNTRAGRDGYNGWLMQHGAAEYRLSRRVLAREFRQAGAWGLYARLLKGLVTSDMRNGGVRIASELRRRFGRKAIGGGDGGPLMRAPDGVSEARAPEPERLPVARAPVIEGTTLPAERWRPAGMNLVGYARGELGVGEDVRTAGRAFASAGVPFGVVNVSRALAARQADHSADHWIRASADFRANLFCVSGIEMFNTFLELGYQTFDGRYNIGYWPWELPHWPDECMPAFYFVDEVWASSRFTFESVSARSPVPVRHMPLAVTLPDDRPHYSRTHFGLPEDRFLFIFTFDCNSFLARKNPFGSLAAFAAAFPAGDEPVGLVVKVMNAREDDPEWRRFKAAAAADPRVALITGTLSRPEVIGLVDACDAYLSLHRAEGFGRGPAEAMLLGKPVVVTDYSGTRDFCSPETACPVRYRLVPVGDDEYLFPAGQEWAEPDVEDAARHMRRLVAEPGFAAELGGRARSFIETHHSPAAVGHGYAARLAELGLT